MRFKVAVVSVFAILLLIGGVIVHGTSVTYSGSAQTASVVLASSTLPLPVPTPVRSAKEVKKDLTAAKHDVTNAQVALKTLLPKFSADVSAAFQSAISGTFGQIGEDKQRPLLVKTQDRSLIAEISASSVRAEVGLNEWRSETKQNGTDNDAKLLVTANNGVAYVANLENFLTSLTKLLHSASGKNDANLKRVLNAQEVADSTQTKLLTLIKDLTDKTNRENELETELNRTMATTN